MVDKRALEAEILERLRNDPALKALAEKIAAEHTAQLFGLNKTEEDLAQDRARILGSVTSSPTKPDGLEGASHRGKVLSVGLAEVSGVGIPRSLSPLHRRCYAALRADVHEHAQDLRTRLSVAMGATKLVYASTPLMCPATVSPVGAFGERVACVASFTLPTSVGSNALDSIVKDPWIWKSRRCTKRSSLQNTRCLSWPIPPRPPTAVQGRGILGSLSTRKVFW